ncbi:preprotein translocase subunit SecA [Pseudoroseomonas wenyumeiae]|uniref:Protein translocase subunit SecA n=1 Tax=Teichococcus wenyumeiae TaxID=2478470 RepID=A0A3A9JDF5_9PROT|nr:preprotein translocase subunit SecA [Pseudoroseomonas wenyumeiae]RKK04562.1 preprotein translocase subunit SecA [Pseudoroseomonas wenyumeiae]RMI20858.1 preprotein translocase subunit SecA [Pseudoroseomonas wenyumeiae]
MFARLARAVFGTANDRVLKQFNARLPAISGFEPKLAAMPDAELQAQTARFRERLAAGETLDDLLPEAFATVREASKRVLGMRHFDVQMIGGMVLHSGRIAEMKTGEGKTLVATLAVYLNALPAKGVHVVTVNDYLASRDSAQMGKLYGWLGLTTGCVVHGLTDEERRAAYAADVTYGTNNEFGFDYLRDNMKYRLDEMVQRDFAYAIVDEVDSILVDEARTPLIISGPSDDSSDLYRRMDVVVRDLVQDKETFDKDEKLRSASLTEKGGEVVEQMMRDAGLLTEGNLYDSHNISLVHHVNQALRAHVLFSRDVDYIVSRDGKLVIIDEFTGRMMEGRRYSDGLHQALEAKEGVEVQPENQTLASITFQNYFRMYPKLSGMTGTAATEADEFAEIYKLEVVEIPTNVPVIRKDSDDEVYRSAREKYEAVAVLVKEAQARQQPVLVGTTSIEKSELISELLKKQGVPHKVLNARYHEQEAGIVAQAGRPGAVTIATNMAGRGTDIKLGGNALMMAQTTFQGPQEGPEWEAHLAEAVAQVKRDEAVVKEAGGLFVIGTERHESRRIDNQLRGRSGRQGDPGASRFFLSLEDDLMRIFGSDRMGGMLEKLGLKEGEAIIHPWINRALEKAQKKVEARNFDTRKNLLKYDDVMNDQRKEVYAQRRAFMQAQDVSETIEEMRRDTVSDMVARAIPENAYPDQWDLVGLERQAQDKLGLVLPIQEWGREEGIDEEQVRERLQQAVDQAAAARAANTGPDLMRMVEKSLLLQVFDAVWKEHLLNLDHLRQGIGLRAFAQRDPLNEYKSEAFNLFNGLLDELRERVTSLLMRIELQPNAPPPMPEPVMVTDMRHPDPAFADAAAMATGGADVSGWEHAPAPLPQGGEEIDPADPSTWYRTPRNAACPCGSGKKYKHCHGKLG